jgi:hypothetical protein
MAATMIALSPEQYEALRAWAKAGVRDTTDGDELLMLLKRIDVEHNIQRYTLVVRWQRLVAWGTVLPAEPLGTPQTPRGETRVIELLRPPTRGDVMAVLEREIYHESLVWVTADPAGEVGWYDLAHFPWQ